MSLPLLSSDALHVLVFGPGIGELVMVRAPPDDWLVIDGCSSRAKAYAPAVLAHYRARPRLVVLTHPHADHARGVPAVIDAATRESDTDWPRIGMLPLFASALPMPRGADPAADYDRGVTEQARAAITDRWERRPACRWDLAVGVPEALGTATVRALSPDASLVKATGISGWGHTDLNTLATALVVEWGDRRILLGSDLVESPGGGWRSALSASPTLAHHDVVKIPHHGSTAAIHGPVLASKVPGLVTPFVSGRIPRFDARGGIAVLHRLGLDVFLTALPRAHATQPGTPVTITRAQLAVDPKVSFDPPTAGFPDCFVCASFDGSTNAPRMTFGPGSVQVTP